MSSYIIEEKPQCSSDSSLLEIRHPEGVVSRDCEMVSPNDK